MHWYRVSATGYTHDGDSACGTFHVQANDETEAREEARLAAQDCGWEDIDVGMARA